MADSADAIGISLFAITVIAIICNSVSVLVKLCKEFTNPKLWRYSLLYQDVAHLWLSIGLVLFCINLKVDTYSLCDATGFFLLFGIIQSLLAYLTTGIILLSIQNPGKTTSLSSFHRNVVVIIITPEVALGAVLSFLPYIAKDLFYTSVELDITCFQIRDHDKDGAAYGTLIIIIWWILLIATLVCDVILFLKLWKFNNRVNSAQNNVWQSQLISQGKHLVQISIVEHFVHICVVLITTISIYSDANVLKENNTWIVMTSLAVAAVVHGVVSNVSNVMWTSCCCRSNDVVKEPHRKLKKLELIKIEAPGKLRMKATWNIGKNANKRGYMKVYGVNHLKSWAQEIVMLGMLRRAQHPSLLQCLWTNSSNPYYETMTLISGEIITSDSRIICLELTNGGTLHDFLQQAELPLPEPCQRMIIHDVAEGLFYLHHENILHNNLTTSCIYLKGSLQSMVLRAAVGDFEDAQIYGTLQQSLDNSIKDKRYFFLPDIRSFALIALEIVSKMCEQKFQNRYVNYNSEHVPLKLNLANVISDEDDEFEAQYCYDVEETPRMFESVQPDETEYDEERCLSPNFDTARRGGSLENLMDKNRPTSPDYSDMPLREIKTSDLKHEFDMSDNEEDEEVATFSSPKKQSPPLRPMSPPNRGMPSPERCPSPNVPVPTVSNINQRKSRKDMSRSADRATPRPILKPPQSRSLSPKSYEKQHEQGRCTSPDPMKDEKLQELRKETKANTKGNRKERKFSFNRKKSDESLNQKNGQAFEAFTNTTEDKKRKDGSWLSKPTSILKSITSNDTTVSVFKSKSNDDDNYLDAIEEEEFPSAKRSVNKPTMSKNKQKAEVWDIIDEQYYSQVNRKAMHNLKKTVSGESRSSLWSFISTPEDLDDDDLDDILECLPGMAEPSDFRKSTITVSDIMAEKETAVRKEGEKRKFSYKDLPHSKFELIDYYEMLKARQITMNDVPEEKRELLLNVVEMKREERLKQRGPFVGNGAIGNDEMYDNGMNPGGSNLNTNTNNGSGKVMVVSFRKNQCHSSPNKTTDQERDPRLDRARSAPLKRPRTPMHKPTVEKSPQVNSDISENKTTNVAKRNRARTALKRALNSKGQHVMRNDRDRTPDGEKEDLTLKYATVRKINVSSADPNENVDIAENKKMKDQTLTVPVPTSESFSLTSQKTKKSVDIKRFSSFSSNESASSVASSVRVRKADVSLTSGEVSSLSSLAESDHYETDGHITDIEGPSKNTMVNSRKLRTGPPSRVDSGFDSGSVSSEMSDAMHNRVKQYSSQVQSQANSKRGIGSWARNYKMVDSIPNSPYNFTNKFLPPVNSLPEEIIQTESSVSPERPLSGRKHILSGYVSPAFNGKDADGEQNMNTKSSFSTEQIRKETRSGAKPNVPSPRFIEVSKSNNKGTINLNNTPVSSNRPLSPPSRPMSPNVQPTNNRTKAKPKYSRPFSPLTRVVSPTATSKPASQPNRPLTPTRMQSPHIITISHEIENQQCRPLTPNSTHYHTNNVPEKLKYETPTISLDTAEMETVGVGNKSVSQATKRYRELVKQGVPLRTSVIDASPTRVRAENSDNSQSDFQSRPGTADSNFEQPMDDQQLFADLESKGFFVSRSRSPSPFKGTSPKRGRSPNNDNDTNNHNSRQKPTKRKKNKAIPLDQIVRENPESSNSDNGRRRPHRSVSNHHLAVTDEAFLNQPTSEDSETCSIKTNKSNTSTPSRSKPKVMVDAELVIDRIFSQNQPQDYELDVEVEAALGLDKDPFKQLKQLYSPVKKVDVTNLNDIALLQGVSQKHIHGCLELASSMHVITVRDLLPATRDGFEVLRNKLQQVGQLGAVGNQLLDIIQKCWLLDMPPTSGDLVEQLTDPVTETEV